MTTLTNKSLLSGGDNKPLMLEKHLYDSWKSIMELYMMNIPHGRMILASVEKGLPTEIYALVSQHRVAKDIWEKIRLLMQGTSLTKQERECKLYDEFDKFTYKKGESLHEYYLIFTLLLNDMNIYKMPLEQFQVNTKFLNTLPAEWSKFVTDVKLVKDLHTTHQMTQSPYQSHQHSYQNSQQQQFHGDDPIDFINHVMSFLSAVVTSCYPTINNQSRNSSNPRQQATINDGRVIVQPVHGRQISYAADPRIPEAQAIQTVTTHNAAYQADDLDAYDSDCDELNTAKVALMANLSNYGLDTLVEVHNHDNVDNNMINQAVQVMPSSEQSNVVNHSETEITSDSNIIPYSYVNDTLTAELKRYKEQVKVLNEGQNVDLKNNDTISDSCAQSVEIDRLKQTLSEYLKEKESLIQTISLLKDDFKKEESRNIDREIALEKKDQTAR
ncbi:hypothetical protein Tco_0743126 [Tanacetum coccineum]